MVASTQSRPRSRALLIVLLIVIALVAALIAGEFYARHRAKTCLSDQFQRELGAKVDVSLSAKPMLWQVLDKKFPYVGISSDDVRFGPAQGMKVSARADDIDLSAAPGTIGSSSADVEWSDAGILSTMQQQSFGGLISKVTSSSADGTLTFDVAGFASMSVRPHAVGGTVQVDTTSAQVLGIGLPTDLVDGVVKTIAAGLQTYPLGMTAKQIAVDDQGLKLSLTGGAYQFQPISGQQSTDPGAVCGQLV